MTIGYERTREPWRTIPFPVFQRRQRSEADRWMQRRVRAFFVVRSCQRPRQNPADVSETIDSKLMGMWLWEEEGMKRDGMTHCQETTASSCGISAGVTFCLNINGTFKPHYTAIGYPTRRRGISLSQN